MNRCRHEYSNCLVRYMIASGHVQLRQQCLDCGEIHGDALPQNGLRIELLPLVETQYHNPPCEVCGDRFTSRHHWLPHAIASAAGQDADGWPTAWLCRQCHALWHKLVTPGLLDDGWKG